MQYLQGECDYKRGPQGDSAQEQGGTNTFLNALSCPFAIFEGDLALLFANTAFYSLLGTTREASVGLLFQDVFAPVINYGDDEGHPFNSMLDTIGQLSRGVSPVRVVEIRTELEVPRHRACLVSMRLVDICGDGPNDEDDDEHGNQRDNRRKATQYSAFLTDLSQRKMVEEKAKSEGDICQKLLDHSISKPLANALRVDGELKPRTYPQIPIVGFVLREPEGGDDADDDTLIACSLFLKQAEEIMHMFASVAQLQHAPPAWLFAAGYNSGQDDLQFNIGELAGFALAILDVFAITATTRCTLSAFLHIGEITVLPLGLELPTTEIFGDGYALSKWGIGVAAPAALTATEDAREYLSRLPAFMLYESKAMTDPFGRTARLFEVHRGKDDGLEEVSL